MRSTHCSCNTFDPRFFFTHTHTHTLRKDARTRTETQERTWTRSGCDSLHARRGTGDATRPVKSHAGCRFPKCLHTIEFLAFSLMFEIEEQQFPLRSGAHHPEPIEKGEWGSPLFGIHLLQTGKYAQI